MIRAWVLYGALGVAVVVVLSCGTPTGKQDGQADMANDDEKTWGVEVIRVFDAPVEEVWRAWTDPEYVKQWWGPDEFTCPVAELDFRVGGTSLVCMRAPEHFGGGDYYNTWAYTRIDHHERIEYTLHFTDRERNRQAPSDFGLSDAIPAEVPHVITFKPVGEGRTEVSVTNYGYKTEEMRDRALAGEEQCMDKMAALFNDAPG